jgi:fatty-acyl-CoA synthase
MTGSGKVVTFAELDERSLRLSNWLRQSGLQTGDVVGLLSDNNAAVFDVYWATQRSGLYLVPINPRLRPSEIEYVLANSGASALFVGGAAGMEAAGSIACPASVRLRVCLEGEAPGYLGYPDVLAAGSTQVPANQPRGSDMLYSSGTTGRPKGVKHPLPDREVSEPGDTMVAMFSSYFGFDSDAVYLSPAPLYHAAPLRTCATAQALGGTAIVMERYDAEAALAAIENFRVTHSQWVPTMFVRMLKLPEEVRDRYDLSSQRVVIHAAAPCPVDVKQQMMEWWGPKLWEYYSSTEMNGMTMISPDEWLRKPGSVGKPILGTVHICDDDGVELAIGERGLIYFERDTMPFVYHGDPDKTRETQHPQHPTWTSVGDVGCMDEDGYVFLTDRKSFMIISGGVNIYPQEIENTLVLHPEIADVAVIGVPDPEMGEQVKAIVQLVPGIAGSDALAKDIQAFVKSRLAGYKVPKTVDFIDEIPRSPVGKLMKQDLRQRYWLEPAT